MDAAGRISNIGAMLGDPARARMLSTLLDGRAHTATELAWAADIAASTASSHLKKLRQAGMVALESQGRHRYFRLQDPTVARALEALLRIDSPARRLPATGPADPEMQIARTCYDHLAGQLAVNIAAALVDRGYLSENEEEFDLTPAGTGWFRDRGLRLEPARSKRRRFAPRCMDWSERRAHIAGALGAALLDGLQARALIVREPGTRRVTITTSGKRWFDRHLALKI